MSTAFNVYRNGAMDDVAPLLDLGILNSALYLSVGIYILLDFLLVTSLAVLPSNGLTSSIFSMSLVIQVSSSRGYLFSFSCLVSCTLCLLVGIFISWSSIPPSSSAGPSSGSGVFFQVLFLG